MASRPRDKHRKNWPDYLHAKDRDGLYYFWRHPHTGKEYGLGRDFADAADQAIEANLKLRKEDAKMRLADRIDDKDVLTVAEFTPAYLKSMIDKGSRPNTIKTLRSKLKAIDAAIGDRILVKVTTKDLHDLVIEPYAKQGKDRMATSIRSTLNELWVFAIGQGKTETNPVDNLRSKTPVVKRERLTLEQFKVIYSEAEKLSDRWVANMMKLAIVTAQPRECLVSWEFSDVRDGFLWNERGKTGARVKIPIGLTVPQLGWTLDDAIKQCRDRVISRHMLHHNIKRTFAKPGDPIALNAATKRFAATRDATGISWDKSPPSLHEIRSLSLRLYKDARNRDFAQALAGHKQGSTTDIYTDVRGSEWIEVKAS